MSPDAAPRVDAGADAQADAAPPLVDPKSIPGLVLWLDPASGVTETAGKVSAWKDSSASAITVTQPTAANQPSKGTVGGKPVLVGTASTWLEASGVDVGTKLDLGDGDMLAAYVISLDLPSNALGGVLYKTADSAPYNGLQLYGNITLDGKPGAGLNGDDLLVKSPSGDMGDGKLHLVGYHKFGTEVYVSVDGVTTIARISAPKKVIDNTSPLQVGGRPSGIHSLSHRLGDVLVYKGSIFTPQVEAIHRFLKAKNGIP